MPRILIEGTFRASDRERKYRLVDISEGLNSLTPVLEYEINKDFMGDIVWSSYPHVLLNGSADLQLVRDLIELIPSLQKKRD